MDESGSGFAWRPGKDKRGALAMLAELQAPWGLYFPTVAIPLSHLPNISFEMAKLISFLDTAIYGREPDEECTNVVLPPRRSIADEATDSKLLNLLWTC